METVIETMVDGQDEPVKRLPSITEFISSEFSGAEKFGKRRVRRILDNVSADIDNLGLI